MLVSSRLCLFFAEAEVFVYNIEMNSDPHIMHCIRFILTGENGTQFIETITHWYISVKPYSIADLSPGTIEKYKALPVCNDEF